MHKKQVTSKTDRNNIKHRKLWNYINEVKFVNFERIKWSPSWPFIKNERAIEIKERRCWEIEKCIQLKAYINYWSGKIKRSNIRQIIALIKIHRIDRRLFWVINKKKEKTIKIKNSPLNIKKRLHQRPVINLIQIQIIITVTFILCYLETKTPFRSS